MKYSRYEVLSTMSYICALLSKQKLPAFSLGYKLRGNNNEITEYICTSIDKFNNGLIEQNMLTSEQVTEQKQFRINQFKQSDGYNFYGNNDSYCKYAIVITLDRLTYKLFDDIMNHPVYGEFVEFCFN